MTQHGYIAVDQKHGRCPRVRSRAPETIDLPTQGEEVIVNKDGFHSRIRTFFLESKGERTVG